MRTKGIQFFASWAVLMSCSLFAGQVEEKDQVIELRQRYVNPSLTTTYDAPLMILKGERQYLFDEKGQRYLDGYNNVAHVGHCHPYVVAAAAKQMAELNTNTRYLHPLLANYAKRLAATLPPGLDVVFFVNSGSEANDLAYRLARRFTGRETCVNIEHSYHGTSHACVQLSDTKKLHHDPDSSVITLPFPDTYSGAYATTGEYIQQVQATVADKELCALICETIQGCGGNHPLPEGYLAKVFKSVRAAGGVCIADEVQTGFGRVGTHFWAFETAGVVPDIVTMGKPMGNGFPLAAVVTRAEIADAFTDLEYFNTFGGSTLSCAVGMAVLDVIEQEHLQENARVVGDYVMGRLRELQKQHPEIGEVRGRGLFIGIALVKDPQTREWYSELAHEFQNQLKEEYHILLGCEMNVLRIKPPLCFTKQNADELVEALGALLARRRP